jgi:hypothetical protein
VSGLVEPERATEGTSTGCHRWLLAAPVFLPSAVDRTGSSTELRGGFVSRCRTIRSSLLCWIG